MNMSFKVVKVADVTCRRPSWILRSGCRDEEWRPVFSEGVHCCQAFSPKKSIYIGIVSKLTSRPGLIHILISEELWPFFGDRCSEFFVTLYRCMLSCLLYVHILCLGNV